MLNQKEKIFLIFILFLCIFLSISFVSANTNITKDCDDSINQTSSFNDFQMLIDNTDDDEINLEHDYAFNNDTDSNLTSGILINKSIAINGKGHIIDAEKKSRIFNIKSDNVVIKNITLINAYCPNIYEFSIIISPIFDDYDYNAVYYNSNTFSDTLHSSQDTNFKGGAVYCEGNNLKIINSTFINNYASNGGGIYIKSNNVKLINLTFINNTADENGGAIYNSGKNTVILESNFKLNKAKYSDSIFTRNDVNIQNCSFNNESKSILFYRGHWQLDNMTSDYFHSFVKFGHINFKFNLTQIHFDNYNLKITFGSLSYWAKPYHEEDEFHDDWRGHAANKKFCLNINGKDYTLKTNEKSEAEIQLKLPGGAYLIKVYNPITKLSLSKPLYIYFTTDVNITLDEKNEKYFPKFIAKNKVFPKKSKNKK